MQLLRYIGKYPASNGFNPLPLGYRTTDVNWRLWNKLGPRQCVCLRSSNHVLFLETMNTSIHQYGRPEYRRDKDQNNESALKVGPNHQCLQPHPQVLQFCFKTIPEILSRLLRRLFYQKGMANQAATVVIVNPGPGGGGKVLKVLSQFKP